jgi:hypothetical protein
MFSEQISQFRTELDKVLKENQDQSSQEEAIKILVQLHPHFIERAVLDGFCKISTENTPKYDCFTFALDLINSKMRIAVRDYAPRKIGPIQRPGIADVLPGPNFFYYLQLQEQSSISVCQNYDLAVYLDNFGMIKHIGKVFNGNIVSKWGMKGYLWRHGIWEVPNSYGIDVKYYSHLSQKLVADRWSNYLHELARKANGFIEIIDKAQPLL